MNKMSEKEATAKLIEILLRVDVELACVNEDGSYDWLGDFPSVRSAVAEAIGRGPGYYVTGPEDGGHYEDSWIVNEDGSLLRSPTGEHGTYERMTVPLQLIR